MSEWLWPGLSPAQAAGHACVICNRDYLRERRAGPGAWVPVGRSPGTGGQVFACVAPGCARQAAARCYPGSGVVISDHVLTAAGAAYLQAMEAAGDPRYADPDPVVVATVAAAAPLLAAAELRHLAGLLEDRAADMDALLATPGSTDAVTSHLRARWAQGHTMILDCAFLARKRAQAMDPAGRWS